MLVFAATVPAKTLGLQGRPVYVPGEILVQFKSGVSRTDQTQALRMAGTASGWGKLSLLKVKLKEGLDVLQAVEQMKKDPSVLHAQPNYRYYAHACGPPTDTYYTTSTYKWPFVQIQAPQAWDLFSCSSTGPGSSSVTVAILDTGVSKNHPDLAGASFAPGYNGLTDQDEGSNASAADDDFGHGTFVAGIIAAQWNTSNTRPCPPGGSTTGMAGMAPGITLMRIKVLDNTGQGDSFSIVGGIQYASTHGARILNMSLGSDVSFGLPSIEKDALDAAVAADCVIVASSGNDTGPLNFPAAYPPVLAVGATDPLEQVACYSNFGQNLDLVAPGGAATIVSAGCFGNPFFAPTTDVLSARLKCPVAADPEFPFDPSDNNFGTAAGTSASAPFVSGAAALVLSMYPSLTGPEVIQRLIDNTDSLNGNKGWDASTGYGRLNVYRALLPVPTATPEIVKYVTTFNSPNPFYPDEDGSTNITLAIQSAQAVELTIWDGLGEKVLQKSYSSAQLNDNPSNPQFKSFYVGWDGRSGTGQPVKTGVYFYSVKIGNKTGRNKIMVIRGTR